MGTQRGQMEGVLSWLVFWAFRAGTRDTCSALGALVGPVQNKFFLAVHYYNFFVPIAQQAGQTAVMGRLSISVCLRAHPEKNMVSQCKLWKTYCIYPTFIVVNRIFM